MKEIILLDVFDSWQMAWRKAHFFVVYGEVSKKGWKPNSAPLALLGSPYSIYLIVLGFHHDIKFEFIIISWVTEPVQTLEVDYEINYYIMPIWVHFLQYDTVKEFL